MASRNVSIVTVPVRTSGRPLARGWGRHRAPVWWREIPVSSRRGREHRSRGYVPAHLARKASQCRADAPATLCGLSNDLHEA